jgi:hypothetical protein
MHRILGRRDAREKYVPVRSNARLPFAGKECWRLSFCVGQATCSLVGPTPYISGLCTGSEIFKEGWEKFNRALALYLPVVHQVLTPPPDNVIKKFNALLHLQFVLPFHCSPGVPA